MAKMLRKRKQFSRCRVPGHGQKCEVSQEIQNIAITRAIEKREAIKEIEKELSEISEIK